jgi:hypothetical protein
VSTLFDEAYLTMSLFETSSSNGGEASATLPLPRPIPKPPPLKHGEQLLLMRIVVPKNAPFKYGQAFSCWIKEEEEDKETTSATDDDEYSFGDFALHPIPKFVSVRALNVEKKPLQAFIDNRDWSNLKALVKRSPEVCRQSVSMLFQGRRITCLPLHAVFERPGANLSVIYCLLTAFPGALISKDDEGDRLPLHMAAIKGASADVVRFMIEASPLSLQTADREGNLPLHYAAMYSSAAVVKLMADLSPDACQHANNRIRMPLHLVCARIWDQDSLTLSMIMNIIRHNPGALRLPEGQGRLPLHLACEQGRPRHDIVKLLVTSFPAGLLCEEVESGRTPLAICDLMNSSGLRENELVLAFLRNQEMSKKK